jgi:hypothetical protein
VKDVLTELNEVEDIQNDFLFLFAFAFFAVVFGGRKALLRSL